MVVPHTVALEERLASPGGKSQVIAIITSWNNFTFLQFRISTKLKAYYFQLRTLHHSIGQSKRLETLPIKPMLPLQRSKKGQECTRWMPKWQFCLFHSLTFILSFRFGTKLNWVEETERVEREKREEREDSNDFQYISLIFIVMSTLVITSWTTHFNTKYAVSLRLRR